MEIRKVIAVILLGIVLLAALACGPRDGPDATPTAASGEETAEQVRDQALAAVAEVDTCQFDMELMIDMSMVAEGEPLNMMLGTNSTGALDIPGEKMYMDVDMVIEMPEMEEMEISMEVYIVADWVYMGTSIFGLPPTWTKTPMESGDWDQMDIASQQVDLLLGVEVELVGTDTVDGTECYVLEITPDMEKVWALMSFAGAGEALPSDLDIEELVSELSFKQWIAKDTYFTLKTNMDLTLELTPESLDMEAETDGDFDGTAEIALVISLHHINEPVTIELPPEALEAEEAG